MVSADTYLHRTKVLQSVTTRGRQRANILGYKKPHCDGARPAHLSLCGESRRESYESPYCIPGQDASVQPQLAALLAMHAGLLHLLVPTELDIPPDWQSEFMLSVRSMLHVCSSCLRGGRARAHVMSKQFVVC